MADASLVVLLEELEGMARGDRAAVLAELSVAEREQIAGRVGRTSGEARVSVAAPQPVLSEWLTARLGGGRWEMTDAARAALAEAIGDAVVEDAPRRAQPAAPRPSLLGTLGRMFAPKGRAA